MKQATYKKGMVLPIVVIMMGMMMMLGFSTLSLISNQSKFNSINDDTNKALEYAEAGYNQYLWHLNDDLNFYSTDAHNELVNKPIEFEEGYFMLEVDKPSDTDRFVTIQSTGWGKNDPDIKRTILAKIRKKQFVHYVYVSHNDGANIWWTTGDESHGPYHTNETLRIQNKPVFYDTVSYVGRLERNNYAPDFKVKTPEQPQKMTTLDFPESNKDLKSWAEKDGMVFEGRTCIYLDGDKVKIRNQNEDSSTEYSISKDIPHLVIYVDKVPDDNKAIKGNKDKFGIRSGNIFVSGELQGSLTIGAEENIYITHADPTDWYDYDPNDIYNSGKQPSQPPTTFTWGGKNNRTYPETGGITYKNTDFSGNKSGSGSALSSYDNEKKIWTRYSFDKNDKTRPGKDMLGLIANNDIVILHYGWPKKAHRSDGTDDKWDFEWAWKNEGKYVKEYLSSGTYYNIIIKGKGKYATLKVGTGGGYHLRPGNYDVWKSDEKWAATATTYDVAPREITIHAALFSVGNGYGFGYEEYNKGPRKGDITLWGNITQRERKAVGTIGSTGYNKKYAHDPRMFYDYPPHILEPTNVGWEIHEWKETREHVQEKP